MTIASGQKTSLLIPSQLPEFVRDDPAYANFVLFLQAYYEWLEQNNNVEDRTRNILNYTDIDETSAEFLDYFYEDFLSYFPDEILADKQKVAKIARDLYQSKGTQAAYRFLFRTLYNTDVEFFYTKDAVLRASSGKWYITKSLKLDSDNVNFLDCINYRIFGETSQAIATIENAIISGNKIELFISDIQRLFESGEFVRVVDSNNQNVLFGGQILRAKIVGQISQIRVNPTYRGLLYRPGDPVIVSGGLSSINGEGATAAVGETTSGSIQRIKLETGGYGYRSNPNTIITITNAPGAVAVVGSLSPSANSIANVTFVPTDVISLKRLTQIGAADYAFSNVALANANTTLANAFTYTGFSAFPISSVLVENSGAGISSVPSIDATSQYTTDVSGTLANLKNLGILAPIQIISAGRGYQNNDIILFTGGSGLGANAKVSSVGSNGQILSVQYTYPSQRLTYPLGGLGYRGDALPSVAVSSANVAAANAVLVVPGILGDGATFSTIVDRVGSITSINILNAGEDYVAAPNVSLKIQDLVVTNLTIDTIPVAGDIVYQGATLANSTYQATVDSTSLLVPFGNPLQSLYRLRVFNYTAAPNPSQTIRIANSITTMTMTGAYSSVNTATRFDSTGLITYGDGTARADASFLNGLVISQGQYLDTTGQPSSFDVLQSEIYNNFTYQITLEKEIAKYRDTLLNLLHPTGMKVIGRYAMKSNDAIDLTTVSALDTGYTLGYYTGDPGSYVTMSSTWTNYSNNIVLFESLVGANLQNIVLPNSSLAITLTNGFQVFSEVDSVELGVNLQNPLNNQKVALGILAAAVNTEPDATLLKELFSGRMLADINNDGVVTSADALAYTSWSAGVLANTQQVTYISTVLNPKLVSDPVKYIKYYQSDRVTLKDNVWLTYANVAYVTANAGSNVINITSLTGSYNIVNGGAYSNTQYPLKDIVFAGDKVLVANNTEKTVQSVDWEDGILILASNLTNAANSLMSVQRTVNTTDVIIYGPVGLQYSPELITQDGDTIATQDNNIITLG